MHILFLTEHTAPEETSIGFVPAWDIILWNTLQYTGFATYDVMYYDMWYTTKNKSLWSPSERMKGSVQDYLNYRNPDAIIAWFNYYDTEESRAGIIDMVKFAVDRKIKVFQLWPDCVVRQQIEAADILADYMEKHILIAHRTAPPSSVKKDKYLGLWTPQCPKYFYNTNRNKAISVALNGEYMSREDRLWIVNMAHHHNVDIKLSGGRSSSPIDTETYARNARTTSIMLNSSQHPSFPQAKGRVFETLATCSMLLEMANPTVRDYIRPDIDYVEFIPNETDMIDKIRYYTKHENERKKIAESGHAVYSEKYTPQHFWKEVMRHI